MLEIINKIVPEEKFPANIEPEDKFVLETRAILGRRRQAYGAFTDQLDMLWHDIDDGKLQADTTSGNTWYHHIKAVKESNPWPVANTSS